MPPATRGRTLYCVFCGGPRDKTSCEKKCLIWPQFLQIPLEIQQNTGRTRTTPSFARTCESRITSLLILELRVETGVDSKCLLLTSGNLSRNNITKWRMQRWRMQRWRMGFGNTESFLARFQHVHRQTFAKRL